MEAVLFVAAAFPMARSVMARLAVMVFAVGALAMEGQSGVERMDAAWGLTVVEVAAADSRLAGADLVNDC